VPAVLKVASSPPGARILVDGTLVATTRKDGLAEVRLPSAARNAEVRLEKEGFLPFIRSTKNLAWTRVGSEDRAVMAPTLTAARAAP